VSSGFRRVAQRRAGHQQILLGFVSGVPGLLGDTLTFRRMLAESSIRPDGLGIPLLGMFEGSQFMYPVSLPVTQA
jgi:hypothetical protein